MSLYRSSTRILQPTCSPKNVTFEPTTGPRSSSSGCCRALRPVRNFASAFVGWTGESTAPESAPSWSSLRRREKRSERAIPPALARGRLRDLSGRLRLRLRHGLARGPLLRLLSRLPALALHVDAAAEVRALRDGHARRHDIAVHGAAVADVHLLRRGDVAVYLTEHDHGLSKHRRLDLAVRADGQHVVLELDLAFDVAFDREVLAAVQLAFDDDG